MSTLLTNFINNIYVFSHFTSGKELRNGETEH